MEYRTITITEVNMDTGNILGRDEHEQQLMVSTHFNPGMTVMPSVGESWWVTKNGLHWFLERRADDSQTTLHWTNMEEGDGRVDLKGDFHINATKVLVNGKELVEPTTGVRQDGDFKGSAPTIHFKNMENGIDFNAVYNEDSNEIDIFATLPVTNTFHFISTPGQGDIEFQNSWVNYDTSTYAAAGFWLDPFGWVHIQGMVKSGTVNTIFTLPEGYRPNKNHIFIQDASVGLARVDIIASSGNVTLQAYKSSGTNTYVSLDGITFPILDIASAQTAGTSTNYTFRFFDIAITGA